MRNFDNPSFRAHHHNGLLGSVAMAKTAMDAVGSSPTTTDNQKEKADAIWARLADLYRDLEANRIDL